MAVTIRDVAREAGVSISTVSRALAAPEHVAEATRLHVESIALRMGYRPNSNARSLITGRSGSIGLVVPDLENPYFGSVCKGVQARARAAGYTVFVADTDEDPAVEAEAVHSLIKQVDGVILCSARTTDDEIRQLAIETPLVLANRYLAGIPSIIFDNRGGLVAVMRHLVALGHRRIAYAGGPLKSWSNTERAWAFSDFGKEHAGVELTDLGNFPPYFSGGVQAADLAVASGATAVVAFNDIMALGVIDRLRQRGLTAPDDMSVTGFDNVAASIFSRPNLTTVDLPRVQMGRLSFDALLDSVRGTPKAAAVQQLTVDLVIRQSSGVPRQSAREPVRVTELLDDDVQLTDLRLSAANLAFSAATRSGVTGPLVDPEQLTIGIVHFGIGAFHRAHQAVFTEEAAAATGDTRWGIMGVTGRRDAVVRQLRPQDCLYGVLERGVDSTSLMLVGSVRDVAWPGTDSARVAEMIARPSTHIATLTITEKGYLRAADGGVDLSLDVVRHDVAIIRAELAGESGLAPSKTPLGLLVRGLARRFGRGAEPFTVIPCDNLTDNGPTTQRLVASLVVAAGLDGEGSGADQAEPSAVIASFVDWLATSVTFPSTVVDRITPPTTEPDRLLGLEMLGLKDDALVVAEPFRQWVIEDRFVGPRPAWERAGAILTADVAPYERVKLRVLNGAHSMLAYLGALTGHKTIAQAVADVRLRDEVLRALDDDVLPTLDAPVGLDLEEYRDSVLRRFANPNLEHTTLQVGMDGSQKIPFRFLSAAADRLAAGHLPHGLALALAAWITFIAWTSDDGGPALDDPLAATLKAAVGSSTTLRADPASAVDRVFAIEEIFPATVSDSEAFRAAVVSRLWDVRDLQSASAEV